METKVIDRTTGHEQRYIDIYDANENRHYAAWSDTHFKNQDGDDLRSVLMPESGDEIECNNNVGIAG